MMRQIPLRWGVVNVRGRRDQPMTQIRCAVTADDKAQSTPLDPCYACNFRPLCIFDTIVVLGEKFEASSMMWPYAFCIGILIVAQFVNAEVVQGGVSANVVIEAKCDFTIHDGGADGKELKGTQLNSELYYKIRCEPRNGYCLQVSSCTVRSAGQAQPYPIIDGTGCTNEPSLFEHVEYLDDFTAGIFNPVPIRFRGAQSGVKFECSTLLTPSENGKCTRLQCPKLDNANA